MNDNVEEESKAMKLLKKIDLFAFLPVPKTDHVSSKRSMIGSAIMFTIFLLYIIAGFISIFYELTKINSIHSKKCPKGEYLHSNYGT